VDRAKGAADVFFGSIAEWAATRAPRNLRVEERGIVEEQLSDELSALSALLEEEVEEAERRGKGGVAPDLAARSAQFSAIAASIRAFLDRELPGQVYWVDLADDGRKVELRSAPVRVGPDLAELLYDEVPTIVLTSATLTIGRNRSFSYFRDRLGLPEAEELALGSPFDFSRQARIYLPKKMPDPRSGEGFDEAVADEVVRAVVRSEGRAFVLFTSYRMLDRVHELTRFEIEGRGYRVLRQGGGLPRSRLLELFREDVSSVLFGTNSFWQGVDVPGEALSHVVIAKLPFDVPDRPLVQARTQEIEARGGNSFMEYSLPRAVLRLKQGFGRLIRKQDDRGAVTILDPRVVTKRYGRLFLESLPECEVVRD
jgi:ATP-dependent DNA helicase DinG